MFHEVAIKLTIAILVKLTGTAFTSLVQTALYGISVLFTLLIAHGFVPLLKKDFSS